MRWPRAAAGLVAVAILVGLAWWLSARGAGPRGAERQIPGVRIPYTVEVLNGTTVDGLAGAVTARLRRAGVDVVFYGASAEPADSTLIIVRGADPAAGSAVRDALGFGRVVVRPDPGLVLDVSVVLGADAAPRPEGGT